MAGGILPAGHRTFDASCLVHLVRAKSVRGAPPKVVWAPH